MKECALPFEMETLTEPEVFPIVGSSLIKEEKEEEDSITVKRERTHIETISEPQNLSVLPKTECDFFINEKEVKAEGDVEALAKESSVKSSVLAFDAYGNLTSGDDLNSSAYMSDFHNHSDYNYIIESFENTFRKESSRESVSPVRNGSFKRSQNSKKNKKKRPLSDQHLEKAFKADVSAAPMSRYGRTCKQRSEKGFLFGTLNFNELNKLHFNSKKSYEKELSLELLPSFASSTDSNDSSGNEFQDSKPFNIKEKKLNDSLSSLRRSSNASESELEKEIMKRDQIKKEKITKKNDVCKKRGRPRKIVGQSSLSDGENKSKKYLKIHQKKRRKKHIGPLEDDVNIIKSSLMTSEAEETDGIRNLAKPKVKKVKVDTAKSTVPENFIPIVTKFGRQIKKPHVMEVVHEKRVKEITQKNDSDNDMTLKSNALTQEAQEKLLENGLTQKYSAGDVVWIIMKGYPMWPAVVSRLLNEECFVKDKIAFKPIQPKYHVKILCDNNRTAWVLEERMLQFRGKDQLLSYVEEIIKDVKKNSFLFPIYTKTLYFFNNKTQRSRNLGLRMEDWKAAVSEAASVSLLERDDRIKKFSDESMNAVADVSRKRRRPSTVDSETTNKKSLESNNNNNNDLKPPNGDDFLGFDDSPSVAEERKLKLKRLSDEIGSFDIYCQQHLPSFLVENPGLTSARAKKRLMAKWRKLSVAQKARYGSRCSSEGYSSSSPSASDDGSDSDSGSRPAPRRRATTAEGKGSLYKIPRNDKVCGECHRIGGRKGSSSSPSSAMVKCKGVCNGVFHLACLDGGGDGGSEELLLGGDFKCSECQSRVHRCFVCKSVEGVTVKCSVALCGKFYHSECARRWPQVNRARQTEKLICPRHVCHMCAANADDMNDPAARTSPFTRCIFCPTTYHTGDMCVAAGVEELSLHSHVCTKHINEVKSRSCIASYHCNVNWCFCCSKGGSLLLCDQCPAAFHADCMDISTPPEGGYICEDCENGKFPIYGDVVWVKLGVYRWWPGEVLHPRFIPDNIEHLSHQQGMFCVHFLGTNDYFWVSRGRTFLYQEGDQGSKGSNKSKPIEKQFGRALNDAIRAYRRHKEKRDKQEATRSIKGNKKPMPYVRVDTNRPVGNVRLGKLDPSAVNKCECDPFLENPCGSDDKCLNRMLLVECIREVCAGGERCKNQRFQRRLYPNVAPFKTSARGWGLMTKEPIKKGDFVIEYVGELIDDGELKRRICDMQKLKEANYYFLTIDKERIIDAGPKGNVSRFMNHSCDPNCETQKWTIGADTRVGLFAMGDIEAGSELTFNYNLECVGTGKKKCHCGSAQCSGFIGVKVQQKLENGGDKIKKKKKKKKRLPKEPKPSEDECFRCGAPGGDLLLCDAPHCPKGYHLKCLDLKATPRGKWLCPWHHCDECGVRAKHLCRLCPNSFCPPHAPSKFHTPGPGISANTVCLEHREVELETSSNVGSGGSSRSSAVSPEAPPT